MVFTCSHCGHEYPTTEARWRCQCGGYFRLRQTPMFDRADLAKRQLNLWRYREALGIEAGTEAVSLAEGWTPLTATQLGGREFLLKLDYLTPTGSYKDRGSSVMISQLQRWGVRHVVEDSSGNAGASVAAYAAKAGMACDIFIPASTSSGKAAQIAMYGASLRRISGSREQTTEAALAAATNGATFYASHNWSPYFVTGMKTIAYEVAEQLQWQVPDWVVLPVGGGSLLVGVYLGFKDLAAAGITSRVPKILAVQAAACAPVERAWTAGLNTVPAVEKRPTAAEGISVARPVRGEDVLDAIRGSEGRVATVEEDQLWESFALLARHGVYVEPTSAAAPAAALHACARGLIAPSERVVVVLTGIGLKATDKIVEYLDARTVERAASAEETVASGR